MSAPNDGWPAFPQGDPAMRLDGQSVKETQGMSLRDYFAAKAMQGLCANAGVPCNPKNSAITAYQLADAMIAERLKP